MHKQGLKAWVVPCAIAASVWVKWCIGLGSYSGTFEVSSSGHQNDCFFRLRNPTDVR